MMQKTLRTAALAAVLLFSACGEDSILDITHEQDEADMVHSGNNSPPAPETGQEIQAMEPFDAAVFNKHKAAWEANHPRTYKIFHDHRRSQTDLHTGNSFIVVDDIPRDVISEDDIPDKLFFAPPGEDWLYPFVFCNTISDLYEKINALWTEQHYEGSAFLIKYDSQLNYPTAIQIKNIYNSGYDYLVQVTVNELDRDHIDDVDLWPSVPEPVLEPFDLPVFTSQRAAWEEEHPDRYDITQKHSGPPGIFLSGRVYVINNIPEYKLCPGKNNLDPWLRCNTISELYEKIEALWTEQHNTGAVFLIKYNGQRHYPTNIQINNINGSGYDYKVSIEVVYEGDIIEIWV
jgi:hypothetical protein